MRDPEGTRRRLLAAGAEEFAAHGIAGARVERIAEASKCNKQSIYGHFGSKDGLFEAVFDEMVTTVVTHVAFDANDLSGYAGQMFDWFTLHPEVLRLTTWRQLERGGMIGVEGTAAEINAEKVKHLRDAQDAGVVNSAIPAEHLLMLVYRLITVGPVGPPHRDDGKSQVARGAVVEAVRRLAAP